MIGNRNSPAQIIRGRSESVVQSSLRSGLLADGGYLHCIQLEAPAFLLALVSANPSEHLIRLIFSCYLEIANDDYSILEVLCRCTCYYTSLLRSSHLRCL